MKNLPAHFEGCLKFISLFAFVISSFAFAQNAYYRMVRTLETYEFGISSTSGLTFSPQANTFLIVSASGAPDITLLTILDDLTGSIKMATSIPDPVNMAFDDKANSLLFLDADANDLFEIKMRIDGRLRLSPGTIARFRIPQFDLKHAKGMTFNSVTGELFILDAQGPRVIRIMPDFHDRFDGSSAEQGGRISTIMLNSLRRVELQGIAFNPGDGHFYVMGPTDRKLYELSGDGEVVTTRDLSSLNFGNTQGMVFAPSGDQTDDPAIENLYIVDSDRSSGRGGIVELTLIQPKQPTVSRVAVEFTFIQNVHTSEWDPPSPDASGIAYIPSSNHLIVCDGEVNEDTWNPPIWGGANAWEITLSGNQFREFNTLAYSDEPSGVAYNPNNQHLYSTDDTGTRSVYELDPGPDGLYGTSDDSFTSLATGDFGSGDISHRPSPARFYS